MAARALIKGGIINWSGQNVPKHNELNFKGINYTGALRVKPNYWYHYTDQKSNRKKPWRQAVRGGKHQLSIWKWRFKKVKVTLLLHRSLQQYMSWEAPALKRKPPSRRTKVVRFFWINVNAVWDWCKCSEGLFLLWSRSDVAIPIIKRYRISIKAGTWEEIFAVRSLLYIVPWISSSLLHILRYLMWCLSLMKGQVSFILLTWVSRNCFIYWHMKSLASWVSREEINWSAFCLLQPALEQHQLQNWWSLVMREVNLTIAFLQKENTNVFLWKKTPWISDMNARTSAVFCHVFYHLRSWVMLAVSKYGTFYLFHVILFHETTILIQVKVLSENHMTIKTLQIRFVLLKVMNSTLH